jgi:hypothetical protein
VIDDELLVKTRTNTFLSYASAIPSYSVIEVSLKNALSVRVLILFKSCILIVRVLTN